MRHRGLRSAKLQITNNKSQVAQRGYMMITLMLVLALMTIALLAALPNIRTQINRDREDEMRHRGTAYMRAIQHFYKKFGRYPGKVEELENTNNVRFLRKRYTDPVNRDRATGKEKDFKFLHQQDISLNNGPVLGQTPGQGALGAQGAFGGAQGGAQGALGAVQGALGALAAQTGGIQQNAPSSLNSASGDAASSSSGGSPSGTATDAQGNSS